MVAWGLGLILWGLVGEVLVGRFHGFFDLRRIWEEPEPYKLLVSRVCLVIGVALLVLAGLAEVA